MTDLKASSLRALKLMDLTTLNDDDTDEKVIALCHQAKNSGRQYRRYLYLSSLYPDCSQNAERAGHPGNPYRYGNQLPTR